MSVFRFILRAFQTVAFAVLGVTATLLVLAYACAVELRVLWVDLWTLADGDGR